MVYLPSNQYKRNTEEGLTCLQVKDILKRDLSKKGVAGIMRNGIILKDRVHLNVSIIDMYKKQYRYQLC